jgi:RNA polymerase sigma-70 factor, ECF subfamily
MDVDESDRELVKQVRQANSRAWQALIDRFEGRLMAFVDSRLRNRATSEDVVQDVFMGFLVSLPNYDETTPLESFLFAIASHKLTDVLRRQGRRPTIPLFPGADSDEADREPAGKARVASSLVRSQEGRHAEETVLCECLQGLIGDWLKNGEIERLQCIELLFVLGWPNKDVARRMQISEQAVANHKHYVVTQLKNTVKRSRLRSINLADFGIE